MKLVLASAGFCSWEIAEAATKLAGKPHSEINLKLSLNHFSIRAISVWYHPHPLFTFPAIACKVN